MKFGCLFAVKDIALARAFYEEIFELKVVDDYGRNITFDCGLSLQSDFHWLTGIDKNDIKHKANNCELSFETDDFESFIKNLYLRDDITLLHDVMEHPWGQHVIRFYDLDDHLIEVGESMKSVVEFFLSKNMSYEKIAEKMDVTAADVHKMLNS